MRPSIGSDDPSRRGRELWDQAGRLGTGRNFFVPANEWAGHAVLREGSLDGG